MLQLNDVSYAAGAGRLLFSGLTLDIDAGARIALTGVNGAGKTTILRLIAGELAPDAGTITRRTALRIAYLRQEPSLSAERSAFDTAFAASAKLDELRRTALEDPFVWEEYRAANGPAFEARVRRALRALGLDEAAQLRPLDALSTGQRMRVELARVVLSDADMWLLDEPTNHLDSAGRLWLERELARATQACVFVSHDRAFLDAVATRVVLLERGAVRIYAGNYSAARSAHAAAERSQWADYDARQRRIAAERVAAEKRLRLAAKVADGGPEANAGARPFYEAMAGRIAKTARMLRERSVRLEPIEKPWQEPPPAELDFAHVPRSDETVARLHDVTLQRGSRLLFDHFAWTIRRASRWVLTGPNGCGKTTLLRLLLRELTASGEVELGARTRIGYLAQEGANLPLQRTAVDLGLDVCSDETRVRTMLGCLRLSAEQAMRSLATLSAGERTKAGLAQLLLSRVNLLLLDEPTNHLELEAREALAHALKRYPGALVVVTHDEWLRQEIEAEQIAL